MYRLACLTPQRDDDDKDECLYENYVTVHKGRKPKHLQSRYYPPVHKATTLPRAIQQGSPSGKVVALCTGGYMA